MSLNKFFKEPKEKVRNTNNDFYRKQCSLLQNFRTNYSISDINININNSINFYNNSRNNNELGTNNSYCNDTQEKIINIEDLLILEEKFNEVLKSVKTKNNTPNECFELLNSYQQSSLYNNFENYFKDITSKDIIRTSIMYLIYNVIICYNFSFNYFFFNTCHQYLENILDVNHKSYLLICELISLKIPSDSKNNIWVEKLRKMLKNNLNHIELNNKEFIAYLMSQDYINYKNHNINILLEIKFYSNKINKYLQLFLNSIHNDDKYKEEFCTLFDNINANNLSEQQLIYFFKSKIIRVINQNASVAGIESSSYKILLNENSVKVPYLKFSLKKKFSLVLDLDETLISFKLDPNNDNKGTIRFRPYLDSFLQKVKEKYELIVFTSGTKDYADPLEDAIEQDRKYFDARLYRDHTIACGKDIVKDISRIGRPLDKIIIVENIPQNYRLQKENGILIKSFYGEDIYDTALLSLGDILIKIADEFNDVRIGIMKYKDEILDKVSTNLFQNK
jgi:Dullard-like phosphatase family protein